MAMVQKVDMPLNKEAEPNQELSSFRVTYFIYTNYDINAQLKYRNKFKIK